MHWQEWQGSSTNTYTQSRVKLSWLKHDSKESKAVRGDASDKTAATNPLLQAAIQNHVRVIHIALLYMIAYGIWPMLMAY